MRRVTLVVTVAVTVAAMIALTVGSALAKADPGKVTYLQKLNGVQYNAVPPSAATGGVGTAQFRGRVSGDLPGVMDATLYYTGRPDENVTTEIIGGTWILCSAFTAPPRDTTGALIEPRCTDTSAIKLTGTWRGGTAKWDEGAGYANVGPPGGPQILVYAGEAEVKATLGVTGGTVDGVSVNGGSGKFEEGTLDHSPLAAVPQRPPTVSGDMTLKF
jgi:hypothetical protein